MTVIRSSYEVDSKLFSQRRLGTGSKGPRVRSHLIPRGKENERNGAITHPKTFLPSGSELAGLSFLAFGAVGPIGPSVTGLAFRAPHALDPVCTQLALDSFAVAFVVAACLKQKEKHSFKWRVMLLHCSNDNSAEF